MACAGRWTWIRSNSTDSARGTWNRGRRGDAAADLLARQPAIAIIVEPVEHLGDPALRFGLGLGAVDSTVTVGVSALEALLAPLLELAAYAIAHLVQLCLVEHTITVAVQLVEALRQARHVSHLVTADLAVSVLVDALQHAAGHLPPFVTGSVLMSERGGRGDEDQVGQQGLA